MPLRAHALPFALRVPLVACALYGLSVSAQVATPPPSSSIYKCRGDGGTPVYQESPCEPGRELRDFGADPANVSVIPFRNAEPAPPPRAKSSAPAKPVAPREPARDRRAGDARKDAPAVDPAERRHLRVGMSEIEVRAKLGPPDMASGKSGTGRWSYLPAPGDPSTTTIVHFERGRVTAVERTVVR